MPNFFSKKSEITKITYEDLLYCYKILCDCAKMLGIEVDIDNPKILNEGINLCKGLYTEIIETLIKKCSTANEENLEKYNTIRKNLVEISEKITKPNLFCRTITNHPKESICCYMTFSTVLIALLVIEQVLGAHFLIHPDNDKNHQPINVAQLIMFIINAFVGNAIVLPAILLPCMMVPFILYIKVCEEQERKEYTKWQMKEIKTTKNVNKIYELIKEIYPQNPFENLKDVVYMKPTVTTPLLLNHVPTATNN